MVNSTDAITTPDAGYELCYECEGQRVCWSCQGAGRRQSGEKCHRCGGSGRCIVCAGQGQLPIGTEAAVDRAARRGSRRAQLVGCFRELGYENGPSVEELRGKRAQENKDRVVAYLRAGKVLVMTPQLVRDVFDRNVAAGSRSIRTDGVYAWPDGLAHYVDHHAVSLPAEFEEHMARQDWKVPAEVDLSNLDAG